jgi:hypothetical protein
MVRVVKLVLSVPMWRMVRVDKLVLLVPMWRTALVDRQVLVVVVLRSSLGHVPPRDFSELKESAKIFTVALRKGRTGLLQNTTFSVRAELFGTK